MGLSKCFQTPNRNKGSQELFHAIERLPTETKNNNSPFIYSTTRTTSHLGRPLEKVSTNYVTPLSDTNHKHNAPNISNYKNYFEHTLVLCAFVNFAAIFQFKLGTLKS